MTQASSRQHATTMERSLEAVAPSRALLCIVTCRLTSRRGGKAKEGPAVRAWTGLRSSCTASTRSPMVVYAAKSSWSAAIEPVKAVRRLCGVGGQVARLGDSVQPLTLSPRFIHAPCRLKQATQELKEQLTRLSRPSGARLAACSPSGRSARRPLRCPTSPLFQVARSLLLNAIVG